MASRGASALAESIGQSNKTVTVACKVPNGLILQVWNFDEIDVPVLGGGTKKEKKAIQTGEKVFIKGPAVPKGARPNAIAGGYALTRGVPLDFWNKWLSQYADSAMVKNQMIYAYEKPLDVIDWAKERRGERSNMEPLRPGVDEKGKNVDHRIQHRKSLNLTAVDTNEDTEEI